MSQKEQDSAVFLTTGCLFPFFVAALATGGVESWLHVPALSIATFVVVLVLALCVGLPAAMKGAEEDEYRRYVRRRDRTAANKRRYDRERRGH